MEEINIEHLTVPLRTGFEVLQQLSSVVMTEQSANIYNIEAKVKEDIKRELYLELQALIVGFKTIQKDL